MMSQKNMVVAPSKAVNAGGVGVSALEMSQNSERLVWTAEEVDAQLHKMMQSTSTRSPLEAAEEYGLGYNLVAGANIGRLPEGRRRHDGAGRILRSTYIIPLRVSLVQTIRQRAASAVRCFSAARCF